MKKILQMCLIAFCVLGCVGCTGSKVSEEAIDRYVEVSKNSMNMKSADYSINMDLNMNEGDIQIKAYGAYDANSNLKMNMNMDMTVMGEVMSNVCGLYIEDSIAYVDLLGEKEAYSFAEFNSVIDYFIQNSLQQSSEVGADKEKIKEMFKAAELKDEHLILIMDKTLFEDAIKENAATSELEDFEMTVSDLSMDITLEDNFMSNIVMDFQMKVSAKGQETQNMKFHMNMGVTNINAVKEIPTPDISEYPDPSNFTDAAL